VRLAWQQGENWKAAVQLPAPTEGYVRDSTMFKQHTA
jgi:hypothetical protein